MALSPKSIACLALATLSGLGLASCGKTVGKPTAVVTDGVVVSVRDQKLAVLRQGEIVKTYRVSTSKFGLGDQKGSCRTPLGTHSVAAKIGDNTPKGMVFKSRKPTGEIVSPNSPGRDPIVSRIIWLRGHESRNRNAYSRLIYIHGTAEEHLIGKPASYGCIRMRSSDIVDMYPYIRKGEPVVIELCSLKASTDAAYAVVHPEMDPTRQLASNTVAAPVVTAATLAPKPVARPRAAHPSHIRIAKVESRRKQASRYRDKTKRRG